MDGHMRTHPICGSRRPGFCSVARTAARRFIRIKAGLPDYHTSMRYRCDLAGDGFDWDGDP